MFPSAARRLQNYFTGGHRGSGANEPWTRRPSQFPPFTPVKSHGFEIVAKNKFRADKIIGSAADGGMFAQAGAPEKLGENGQHHDPRGLEDETMRGGAEIDAAGEDAPGKYIM